MKPILVGISSKATAAVLSDLVAAWQQPAPAATPYRPQTRERAAVELESVGGVDALRRVEQGERFDLVFLAAGPVDRLIAAGHLRAPRVDLMRSSMVAAVRKGAERPAIDTEDALRRAVLAAGRIGYSTGPSGDHLLRLLERWDRGGAGGAGAAASAPGDLRVQSLQSLQAIQAPPGVPVGQLLAEGSVTLAFQQRSELLHHPGVDLLGELPGSAALVTVFSAAVGRHSAAPEAAMALLEFLIAPQAAALLRRHGMEPA